MSVLEKLSPSSALVFQGTSGACEGRAIGCSVWYSKGTDRRGFSDELGTNVGSKSAGVSGCISLWLKDLPDLDRQAGWLDGASLEPKRC